MKKIKLTENRLTIYVPRALVDKMKKYAEGNNTTMSKIIRSHFEGLTTTEKK